MRNYNEMVSALKRVLDNISPKEKTPLFQVKVFLLHLLRDLQGSSSKPVLKARLVYGVVILQLVHYASDTEVQALRLNLEQCIAFHADNQNRKHLEMIKAYPLVLDYIKNVKLSTDMCTALRSVAISMRVEALHGLFGWVLDTIQKTRSTLQWDAVDTSEFVDPQYVTLLPTDDNLLLEMQVIYATLAVMIRSSRLQSKMQIWTALKIWAGPRLTEPVLNLWSKMESKHVITQNLAYEYLFRVLLEGVGEAVINNDNSCLEQSLWAYITPSLRALFLKTFVQSWEALIKDQTESQSCVLVFDKVAPDGALEDIDFLPVEDPWVDIPASRDGKRPVLPSSISSHDASPSSHDGQPAQEPPPSDPKNTDIPMPVSVWLLAQHISSLNRSGLTENPKTLPVSQNARAYEKHQDQCNADIGIFRKSYRFVQGTPADPASTAPPIPKPFP